MRQGHTLKTGVLKNAGILPKISVKNISTVFESIVKYERIWSEENHYDMYLNLLIQDRDSANF